MRKRKKEEGKFMRSDVLSHVLWVLKKVWIIASSINTQS